MYLFKSLPSYSKKLLRALCVEYCNTHMGVILYLFKTHPCCFKKSVTKFCIRAIWRQIFFFGEKFTKIDLALKQVFKNHSKLVEQFSIMFSTIWPKYFFPVKSPMGTSLDSVFLHRFFFQLGFRVHEGIQIKNCFGTIKDLFIWFFGN